MNEELQTVNHELQAKLDELSRSSDDMKNLLNSTDIATLFLDDQLRVRRYTTQTSSLIKLIPGDTGRSITDIVSQLDYPAFAGDIRDVLQTLVPRERQVSARDGRWYNVRVMPYRTQDNRIDGVVITFVDVTVARRSLDLLWEMRRVLDPAADGGAVEARRPPQLLARMKRMLTRGMEIGTLTGSRMSGRAGSGGHP